MPTCGCWDIDDRQLLLVSGVACASYALAGFGAPRKLHDLYYEKTELMHEPTMRWFGVAVGVAASKDLVIACSDPNKRVLKNSLKAAGVGWLVCAAHNAYNAQKEVERQDVGLGTAVGQAIFGALCLWRGATDDTGSRL